MNTRVQTTIHDVIRASRMRPRAALEVGGLMDARSLLRLPELEGADRYCLNLRKLRSADGITAVAGNANHMGLFEDDRFDLVLSNATLEHDKRFWLSVAEMRRVLAPGGMLLIAVPGYVTNPARDRGRATETFRVHYRFDYYRFSHQALRDVFFEAMDDIAVQAILNPPRLIGVAFKPGAGLPVDRRAAASTLAAGPLTAPPGAGERRAGPRRSARRRLRDLVVRF